MAIWATSLASKTFPSIKPATIFKFESPFAYFAKIFAEVIGSEDIAAAVVLKEGKTVDQKELRTHLSKSITTFKIPRKILILSEIPKGNTGKIQRIGLAKKLGLET